MEKEEISLTVALRHALHRHPELSMEEHWTKAYLIGFLREHTKLEIVEEDHWFYAAYRHGGEEKGIAFRADMDALPIEEAEGLVPYISQYPGLGHKCGHDGHSAALAGFALMLERLQPKRNVFLLFQHAEETGRGALACLPFLEKENIGEIYAVHNMPGFALGAVSAPVGTAQFASTGLVFHFLGKKSHACYPEDGRNPAFGIAELVLALETIRAEGSYRGMTLITVIGVNVGERAFGTSAGEGELLLTVRGAFEEELSDLVRRLTERAEGIGAVHGLSVEVTQEDSFTDCYNHREAVEKIVTAAEKLQIPVQEMREPFRASEDFGRYTKVVPGAIFYVGAGEKHAPIHTREYDFPDEILPVIADMYAEIVRL